MCRVVLAVVGVLYAGLVGFALVECKLGDGCVRALMIVDGPDEWYRERVLPEVESLEYRIW